MQHEWNSAIHGLFMQGLALFILCWNNGVASAESSAGMETRARAKKEEVFPPNLKKGSASGF